MKEYIGLCQSTDPSFQAHWEKVCREGQSEHDKWIEELRACGVKAAHPDDGWVNRETNYVSFAYPQFDDGIIDGDLLVLGWPDRYRLARAIRVSRGVNRLSGHMDVGVSFEDYTP